jgi:hypothetical protein
LDGFFLFLHRLIFGVSFGNQFTQHVFQRCNGIRVQGAVKADCNTAASPGKYCNDITESSRLFQRELIAFIPQKLLKEITSETEKTVFLA